jgi:membrane protease YdiL (CAAX protease family)
MIHGKDQRRTTLPQQKQPWIRKLSAVLEVVAVFVVGNLLAELLNKAFNLGSFWKEYGALLTSPKPDYLRLAWLVGSNLLTQYLGLFSLIFLVGWFRRKRWLADYGLTRASNKLVYLLGLGLVLFCFSELPLKLLLFANKYLPLGAGSDFWVIFKLKWNFQFWIFMAVGSFLLVPVVEELFYRGYFQKRLEEGFGGLPAVLMTSCFFVFNHSQYHKLTFLSVGTIVTLFISSVAIGYVFYRTRSLYAPIVAHALVDIPTKGLVDLIVLLLMIAVVIFFAKKIAVYLKQFREDYRLAGSKWALALGVIGFSLLSFAFSLLFKVL